MAFNKAQSIVKPHVCAISLLLFRNAVAPIGIIKIIIVPIVRPLPNATTAVDERMLKSLILWAAGIIVTQVPFTKHRCFVTVVTKHFRHGIFLGRHQTTAIDRVPHAGASRISARHQGAASG